MVDREEIVVGLYIRTCSRSFGVPAGTLAQVDCVGTTWKGDFVFTVRWLNLKPGTQVRPISDRSLNLWEQDLIQFEAVCEEEMTGIAVLPSHQQPKLDLQVRGFRRFARREANLHQLSLFTLEDL